MCQTDRKINKRTDNQTNDMTEKHNASRWAITITQRNLSDKPNTSLCIYVMLKVFLNTRKPKHFDEEGLSLRLKLVSRIAFKKFRTINIYD